VWCETDSCYVFHPMNAYDLADGRVVLDVVRHPRMFATDQRGPNEGPSVLERWIADPATGRTHIARLDDRSVEFPRVDERLVGLPHRYGYAANLQNGFEQRGIVRYDLETDTSIVRDEGAGFGFGEPVFIPRDGAAAEDDGWVMALRLDRGADRTDLVVLDAQDITAAPVAVVHLPARVPAGFHGNWCPDA